MLTSFLIFTPVVAAFMLLALPWPSLRWAGGFALVAAVAELGLWIGAVSAFDFDQPGLQFETDQVWVSDFDISYKIGMFDWSLWLVGLMVVLTAAAIGYALWAGRERPRAYFGLILFLAGATIGVLTAQDLLLFYVFFEAMMIPLYVLIGAWGGTNRLRATFKFVAYTLAGSLLMLVAIITLGLEQGTFDLTALGTSNSTWIFLGFSIAFAIKAPIWPFHGWLPDAYREAPIEITALLSGVISKTAAYGFLRIVIPTFPEVVIDWRDVVLALAAIGLIYGSLLAFRAPDLRGIVAYSSLAQMSLIIIGVFAVNDSGLNGALLHMINHGLVSAALFLTIGVIERRTGTDRLAGLGGMARGRPILATMLITTGVIALAVPGSSTFAGEFLVLNGVFVHGWGWTVAGGLAIMLAAAYILRLISAVLHKEVGSAVPDAARDLRPAEVGVILPLVAVLLALSFWPASITDHSFDGSPEQAVTDQFRD